MNDHKYTDVGLVNTKNTEFSNLGTTLFSNGRL